MRGALLWLVAATGCRSLLGFEDPQVVGDGALPGDAACASWQLHGFDACALPIVAGPLVLDTGTYTFDTNAGTLIDPKGNSIPITTQLLSQSDGTVVNALVVGRLSVAMSATLIAIGARPAMIASWSTITVEGTIDAGSHVAPAPLGAGANPSACFQLTGASGADADADGGSGGGGGGAYRGGGGAGSSGDIGTRSGGTGGAPLVGPPRQVRGGCPGGASGTAGAGAVPPSDPAKVAHGGGGGGAIQLAARTDLEISATGRVLAGGAGGEGAPLGSACGGGGGGAGGAVGLDAQVVRLEGTVAANGGGGGGGAKFSAIGASGEDGQASALAARGGASVTCGQPGAAGAAGGTLVGATAVGTGGACGGGGGGGGAGFVLVWSTDATINGVISPGASVGT